MKETLGLIMEKLLIHISVTLSVLAMIFITITTVNILAREHVSAKLVQATRTGDIATIERLTDWDSLRDWLKNDLKERADTAVAKSTGHALSDEEINNLVDFYIRPGNIPSLFYFQRELAPNVSPDKFIRDVKFDGVDRMIMTIAFPPQPDKPWITSLEPVRAIFQLENIEWKLVELHTPFYLLPKSAPKLQK